MSSISFDADFQTDKLEAGTRKANKSIGVFVMESIIKVQKLEREIDVLASKLDRKATPKLLEDWRKKTAELNKETEGLVELQKQEAQETAKAEGAQKGMISSLVDWAKRLGVVTAAITFFKAVIASSNALTEQFEFNIDGAKGALQQFLQVFSANANQTGNVITNMVQGFKGAKELSQAVDAYNDSLKANQVLEAQEIITLKEKEAIFRNASNDATKRKEALDAWIAIKKDAAARELKIEQDLNDALKTEVKNRPNLAGITDSEIGNYVTMYATNPQLMQKAEELSKIFTGARNWDDGEKIAKLRKEIDALLPKGLSYESLMSSTRINAALNEKQIDALRESYKRLAGAQAGGAEVEAETARWMGSIVNKGNAADKKLNDLKNQIDTLKTALATADESERKGIADKIVLLEKELRLREEIVRQSILASELSGFIPTSSTTSQLSMPSLGIHSAPKPTVQKTQAQTRKEMYSLRSAPDIKKAVDAQEAMNKAVDEELRKRQEIFRDVVNLVFEMSKMAGLSEEQTAAVSAGLDMFVSLSEGNYLNAATSLLRGLTEAIPSQAERFQGQIDQINKSLEKQQSLIEQSERIGGESDARQKEIDLLNQEKAAIEAQIAKDQKRMNSWISWFGSKERAQADYMKQLEALDAINEQIAQAEQDYGDFILGGITQISIADAISQGLDEGLSSAADFANTFNDFMRTAINSALEDMSKPAISEWYAKFAEDVASGGGLDEAEKARLKAEWDKIIAEGLANREAAYAVAGISPNGDIRKPSAMVGTLRSISEDTGTEWVGLARRQADDLRMMKDYSKMGINHLVGIEANTAATVDQLKLAVVELKSIVSNTSQSYSNLGN